MLMKCSAVMALLAHTPSPEPSSADLGFPIHSIPAAMPVFEGSLASQPSDVERRAEELIVQEQLAEMERGGEPAGADEE